MSRAWILDVLDRLLPDLVGAERDRIATQIIDAVPVERIAKAIADSAATQLQHHVMNFDDIPPIARDVAANASMAVVEALGAIE